MRKAQLDRALAYVNTLNGRGDLKAFGAKIGCTGVYLSSMRTRQNQMTASLAAKVLANIPKGMRRTVRRENPLLDKMRIPNAAQFEILVGCKLTDCKIPGFCWKKMWTDWYTWMNFHHPAFPVATIYIIGGSISPDGQNVRASIFYEEPHNGGRRRTVWALGATGFYGTNTGELNGSGWKMLKRDIPACRIPIQPFVKAKMESRVSSQ